ncbi:hypothetical protein TNCV_1638351 [Trichonephila clavipes]|nr:hypothetical protein TNCV_1638351 [Trichonephila clavipes]
MIPDVAERSITSRLSLCLSIHVVERREWGIGSAGQSFLVHPKSTDSQHCCLLRPSVNDSKTIRILHRENSFLAQLRNEFIHWYSSSKRIGVFHNKQLHEKYLKTALRSSLT